MCTCSYCGKEFEGEVSDLCPECTALYAQCAIMKCDHCGKYVEGSAARDVRNEVWCEHCAQVHACTCIGCDQLHPITECIVDHHGSHLCADCQSEYYRCISCGDFVHSDDVYWRNDDPYCEWCAPDEDDDECEDLEYGSVHYYSYKPSPRFLKAADEVNPFYLGVELEVGGLESYDDCCDASDAVDSRGEGWVYLKSDCSIPSYGFEVVSHPMTLARHKDFNWKELLQYMSSAGLRSHDVSGCGLHIHISRSALPVSKWIIVDWFINREQNFWERIARRRNNNYAQFKDLGEVRYGHASLRSVCGRSNDRYEAVNFCNEDTVELRLFRGTLRYETFIGTLELVDAVVKWAKQVKVASILHGGAVKSFTDFLVANKYEYAVAYLKYRGLL